LVYIKIKSPSDITPTQTEILYDTNLKTEIKFGSLGDWAGTVGAASCIIRAL
jgi:hypothetical protein